MTECSPCRFCQYYGSDIDWHTGIEDEWCNAPDEFAVFDVKPCPYFKPILPSEGLYEQLANEEEARFQEECDREYEMCMRGEDGNIE